MHSFARLRHCAPVAISLGVAACAPQVAESPNASLLRLRGAVEVGDTAATLSYVDPDAIAARLMRDAIALVEDSLGQPFFDSLGPVARARFDSVQATWRDAFRMDLGLLPASGQEHLLPDTLAQGDYPEPWSSSPDEVIIASEADIIGDGAARYRGDTALVPRVVRYPRLDTTVTVELALVPVERRHWRLIAMPNVLAIGRALAARRVAVLERANRPRRDSIGTRISVSRPAVAREPLEEWDRYAARVQVTVENRSAQPLTLRATQLLGPTLALDDSIGDFVKEPISLRPGQTVTLVWQRPLRGPHPAPYDIVARPGSYTVEVTAIDTHGDTSQGIELYRTWDEYVAEHPLPARPSGVLARRSPRSAGLRVG